MMSSAVPKIVRWRLRLAEFTFEVQHVSGEANTTADLMSRVFASDTEPARAMQVDVPDDVPMPELLDESDDEDEGSADRAGVDVRPFPHDTGDARVTLTATSAHPGVCGNGSMKSITTCKDITGSYGQCNSSTSFTRAGGG